MRLRKALAGVALTMGVVMVPASSAEAFVIPVPIVGDFVLGGGVAATEGVVEVTACAASVVCGGLFVAGAIGYAAWMLTNGDDAHSTSASVPYTTHELGDQASGTSVAAGTFEQVNPADSWLHNSGLTSWTLTSTLTLTTNLQVASSFRLVMPTAAVEADLACGTSGSVNSCSWVLFNGPGIAARSFHADAGCSGSTVCYVGRTVRMQKNSGTTIGWSQTAPATLSAATPPVDSPYNAPATLPNTFLAKNTGGVDCASSVSMAAAQSCASVTTVFAMGQEGGPTHSASSSQVSANCAALTLPTSVSFLTGMPAWTAANCSTTAHSYVNSAQLVNPEPTTYTNTRTKVTVDCSQWASGAWTGSVQSFVKTSPRTDPGITVPNCNEVLGGTWAPKKVTVVVEGGSTEDPDKREEYSVAYPPPTTTTTTAAPHPAHVPEGEVLTGVNPDGSLRTAKPSTNPTEDPTGDPSYDAETGTTTKPSFSECMGSGISAFDPVSWVYVPVKCVFQWAFVPETTINLDAVPIASWVVMPSFTDSCPVFDFSMAGHPVTLDICSGAIGSIRDATRPFLTTAVGFLAVLGGYRRVAAMFGAGDDDA